MENLSIGIKVMDVVIEQLGVLPEEVMLKTNFKDDLGADSLDMIELVLALEKKFNIEIDERFELAETVDEMISCITLEFMLM